MLADFSNREPPPPPGGGQANRIYSAHLFIDSETDKPFCHFSSFCRDESCETVSRVENSTREQFEVCRVEMIVVGEELGFNCFVSDEN